jgi:hypothetical protein
VIDLLILLLVPALEAVEGKSKNPLHWLAAAVAFPLDVLIAHTTWALVFGRPEPYEWTISHTLERLVHEPGPNREVCIALAKKINSMSPTGRHIGGVNG